MNKGLKVKKGINFKRREVLKMRVIIKFKNRIEEFLFVDRIELYGGYLCIGQKTNDYTKETNCKLENWSSFEVINEVDD